MNYIGTINPRGVSDSEVATYSLRTAVRAVVFDEADNIALLHLTRDSYYKLPGGGVEAGEDFEAALRRECFEEIGCAITDIQPIGYTEEYWQEDTEKQTSHCFTAKLVGEKGTPALTESEQERGFVTIWLPIDEAIKKLETCIPTHWEGDYIPARELVFLQAFADQQM